MDSRRWDKMHVLSRAEKARKGTPLSLILEHKAVNSKHFFDSSSRTPCSVDQMLFVSFWPSDSEYSTRIRSTNRAKSYCHEGCKGHQPNTWIPKVGKARIKLDDRQQEASTFSEPNLIGQSLGITSCRHTSRTTTRGMLSKADFVEAP